MNKKIKKKTIRDVEIGDHVKQTVSTKGKKKCGEVLSILQDNPGDPTLECVEVNPDDLTPLDKGTDGIKTFRARRSKLKIYTPRKKLFSKKNFRKGRYSTAQKRQYPQIWQNSLLCTPRWTLLFITRRWI